MHEYSPLLITWNQLITYTNLFSLTSNVLISIMNIFDIHTDDVKMILTNKELL